MKTVTEHEEKTKYNPLPLYKPRKKFPLFGESESKDSSRTASTQGSDPLTRKEFLDVDVDHGTTSKDSSVHSSKGSLGSSDGSDAPLTKRNKDDKELCNGSDSDDRKDKNGHDKVFKLYYLFYLLFTNFRLNTYKKY